MVEFYAQYVIFLTDGCQAYITCDTGRIMLTGIGGNDH